MVYLYAGLGVVMLSGIMAIFEMGLSLMGQSMLPTPADNYFADFSIKYTYETRLSFLLDQKKICVDQCSDAPVMKGFSELATDPRFGLCGALNKIDGIDDDDAEKWTLISEPDWINSCQLARGSHRVVVKKSFDSRYVPYQLFSCNLEGGSVWFDQELEIYRCYFERRSEGD